MSATDELRTLLDERGVEWTANDGEHVKETCWPYMGELMAAFAEYDNGETRFACDTWCFTPEQAVEATLGSFNCTNGERTGTCHADETDRIECGGIIDGRHYDIHVMECSECGHTYEHVNGDYEYCPHCGRRIEVDE